MEIKEQATKYANQISGNQTYRKYLANAFEAGADMILNDFEDFYDWINSEYDNLTDALKITQSDNLSELYTLFKTEN